MALAMLPLSTVTARGVRYDPSTPVVYADGTRTVIDLRGEWDLSTRSVLCDVLSKVIALSTGDVVMDLTEATFIDTAIVRALAGAQQLLDRQERKLTFRSPSRLATRVLHLFGLTDLIEPRQGATP